MQKRNPIYLVQSNHFDPIWRRCWDRSFDYQGKRYRSYAEIEEQVINGWLENAKEKATVTEGQAVVIRKYLERNPERYEEIRSLVRKGIFELLCGGEAIPDTNMPSGETLLRNFVMGQLYFEETFEVIPHIGTIQDAFGQSAQLPQIFRGVECKLLLHCSYKKVPGDYWKGLDGSIICIKDAPFPHSLGAASKIPSCSICHGMGCSECTDCGLDLAKGAIPYDTQEIANTQFSGDPCDVIVIGSEETMPIRNLPEMLRHIAAKGGPAIQFGTYADLAAHYANLLENIDSPDVEASNQVEANPVSTGCYVSRIKIKQNFRRLEHLVNTAERWATAAWLLGTPYPSEILTEAWRSLVFCAFHDAITSTHIDAAYYELMDMMEEAESQADDILDVSLGTVAEHISAAPDKDYLLVFNSESWSRSDPVSVTLSGINGVPSLTDASGNPVELLDVITRGMETSVTFRPPQVPALGYTAIEVAVDTKPVHSGETTAGPGLMENEFYRITVSEKGVTSIFDKRLKQEILDTRNYLLNELILEEDIGHPWGTMQPPSFNEGLARYTTGVSIRKVEKMSEVTLTGIYKGKDTNVKILSWRQSITLYAGYDRMDFHTEIDWDSAQRRIRIAFPTNIKTNEGIYSIPYGAIKRDKYEPEMDRMPSTNGDWPAINWVDLYGEAEERGYALINTGTPSHKIEDGVIYLSVLRSPTDSWCLNEPEFYDCPDFDEARDAGRHEFHYSLIPHRGDYRAAHIDKRAVEVNNPMVVRQLAASGNGTLGLTHSFLQLTAPENIVLTAMKKAERDDSIVVRLAETTGKPAEVSVLVEGTANSQMFVNYLERMERPVGDTLEIGAFKVVTLKLPKSPSPIA